MAGYPSAEVDPLSILRATNNAAQGHADPKTIVTVANHAQSVHDGVNNIQAIIGSGNMLKMYDTLGKMPITHQAQVWGQLKPGEQSSLRALGYNPPNPDVLSHTGAGGSGGGIWGSLWGGVKDFGKGFVQGITTGLRVANVPLSNVQHLYRAAHYQAEESIAQKKGWDYVYNKASSSGIDWADMGTSLDNLFNFGSGPASWGAAWDHTANGNTQIDPSIYRHLVKQYGPNMVSSAINVAASTNWSWGSPGSFNSYLQTLPASQRRAALQHIQSPKFQELMNRISNSRMTVGQELVGERALTANPKLGHAISGGIDAATDILSDPTMMKETKVGDALTPFLGDSVKQGAGVFGATKAALWGVRNADDARQLMAKKGFQDYLDQITPFVENGDWAGLLKKDPRFGTYVPSASIKGAAEAAGEGANEASHTTQIVESLQKNQIDSRAKLENWFENQGGMRAVLTGAAAKQTGNTLMLPHASWTAWQKPAIKELFSNSIDALNDKRFPKAVKLAVDDIYGGGDHASLGAIDQRVADSTQLLEKAKLAGGFGNLPGIKNMNRLLKAMTTNIPDTAGLAYGTGEADVVNFRRYIQGFLPSYFVDHLTNLFTVADEAQRRTLVLAAQRQAAHAMGLFNSSRSAAEAEKLFSAIEDENRNMAYGVHGYDKTPDNAGIMSPHAIYSSQRSKVMRIALPNEMRRIARQNSILSIAGQHPLNWIDSAMKYWRTGVLMRPGFFVRIGLDENAGRFLRSGKGFVSSFIANGATRTRTDEEIADQIKQEIADGSLHGPTAKRIRAAALKAESYKQLLPYHPVEHAMHILADRAPEGVRSNWRNIEEFYGGVIGGMVRRWAREAEGKGLKALGMQEYVDSAHHWAKYQPGNAGQSLEDVIASMTGSDDFTVHGLVNHLRRNDAGKIAYFRKAGPYSEAATGDPLYKLKWQTSLDHIARSPEGQAVLHSIDQSREEQIQTVMELLKSPEFAPIKAEMDRSVRGRVGLLGSDATQEQLDEDWAQSIVDNTNAHLRSGPYDPVKSFTSDKLIQELVDHMKEKGAGPDGELLDRVLQHHQAPGAVVGPDLLPTSTVEGIMSRGFEETVGKGINWITRQPHFQHQYALALPELRDYVEKELIPGSKDVAPEVLKEQREKLISDLAMHRALNSILPYIHNPDLRTQFEDLHRVIFPFLFAQRQFLLRWARTFSESPEAIRKLQLTMNGLTTMGVIQKDANGNDFFYYPGSQYVQEMIAGTINKLGGHASIPFSVPFTGEPKNLIPGLNNPVTPSVGPFVAAGMNQLAKIDPQLQGLNQTVLGQGASESGIHQFLPSIVNRVYSALTPAQAGSEKASTIIMAMKYLDANGMGIPQNPKPGEIETYLDRLNHWATQLLLVRAALGFVLPATPKAQLDPQGLDSQLKELMAVMPYNDAIAEFMKLHPNGSAYTVGTTEAATSGQLPATAADLAFTNEHTDFAKAYPAAFPWLAPRSPGKFSLTEYLEQEATGQRTALPLWNNNMGVKSVLLNIMNAKASAQYYASVDAFDKAYNSAPDTTTRKQYAYSYDQWKASFEARNPTFTAYLNSQQGMRDRSETIRQVRAAVDDPNVPKDSPAVSGLRDILKSFDSFKAAIAPWTGVSGSQGYYAQQDYKTSIIAWGNTYIKAHPEVADFWNTIMRPTIDEYK